MENSSSVHRRAKTQLGVDDLLSKDKKQLEEDLQQSVELGMHLTREVQTLTEENEVLRKESLDWKEKYENLYPLYQEEMKVF